jgi:hypothetical protein
MTSTACSHEDDVGERAAGDVDDVAAGRGAADDCHLRLHVDECGETVPHGCLIL